MKTKAGLGRVGGSVSRGGLRWVLLLLGATLVSAGAWVRAAEPASSGESAWFVEASAGVSIVPGGDILVGGSEYEGEYSNGLLLRAAVGRSFGEKWKAALEWYYRNNEAESFTSGQTDIGGGDLASTNLFLNVTYTFDGRFSLLDFTPYLGAGAGMMQEVDIDLDGFGDEEFSDNWAFGWQWSIGVGRPVGSNGWFFVEGRAISGGELDLESSNQDSALTFDYDTWSLHAGLRWTF